MKRVVFGKFAEFLDYYDEFLESIMNDLMGINSNFESQILLLLL
jgi:hypothetical protein